MKKPLEVGKTYKRKDKGGLNRKINKIEPVGEFGDTDIYWEDALGVGVC
jgi:hypothetical protein